MIPSSAEAGTAISPQAALWVCGCGWTNGANLATCAQCTRTPIEGNALPYTSDAYRAHQRANAAEAALAALRERIGQLEQRWQEQRNDANLLNDGSTFRQCADELAALLADDPPAPKEA